MESKWYVIQTLKGQEEKNLHKIKSEILCDREDAFIIENEKQYRIKGEWIIDRKPFFPGYIFAETDDAISFDLRLRKKLHPLKLVDMDGVITAIRSSEKDYLLAVAGDEHIIKHSAGFRIDDSVEITSGSFKGYTGRIVKLDRHNRRARIIVPLMGRDVEAEIGLEIVEVLKSH